MTDKTPEPAADAAATRVAARPPRLKRGLLMAALPVLLLAGAGAWWMTSGGSQSTDNAYLYQARLSVASSVGGRVITLGIAENQPVKAGTLLFEIDPEPFRIALRKAEVALETARLDVQRLKATYAEAEAQAKLAHDTLAYQQTTLSRQEALTKKGVTSDTTLDDARHEEQSARQTAVAADMAVKAALAALGGDAGAEIDDHPEVKAAIVARDAADWDLRQTAVYAPADGLIYKASGFRPGQMVSAGTTLFTLIETGDTWVEANFKETQLADIRPGQPVEVVLDAAPGVKLGGHVEAIGAGTGAEFSLLPAQNATGNWVKVEQRVPVRIRLDDLAQAPVLAVGLSADVTVDTRGEGRAVVAAQPASAAHAAAPETATSVTQ